MSEESPTEENQEPQESQEEIKEEAQEVPDVPEVAEVSRRVQARIRLDLLGVPRELYALVRAQASPIQHSTHHHIAHPSASRSFASHLSHLTGATPIWTSYLATSRDSSRVKN